jgi:hypothetical protein
MEGYVFGGTGVRQYGSELMTLAERERNAEESCRANPVRFRTVD